MDEEDEQKLAAGGYAYTTSCLVKGEKRFICHVHRYLSVYFAVPCESGNYWKCDVSTCVACPQGFYQPQWGQTSCWPCPFNTTTDFEGATSPTECKRKKIANALMKMIYCRSSGLQFCRAPQHFSRSQVPILYQRRPRHPRVTQLPRGVPRWRRMPLANSAGQK